jgi:hypothetical protein
MKSFKETFEDPFEAGSNVDRRAKGEPDYKMEIPALRKSGIWWVIKNFNGNYLAFDQSAVWTPVKREAMLFHSQLSAQQEIDSMVYQGAERSLLSVEMIGEEELT